MIGNECAIKLSLHFVRATRVSGNIYVSVFGYEDTASVARRAQLGRYLVSLRDDGSSSLRMRSNRTRNVCDTR